jgi:transcriptional regulator with XRE-family HTH domain
MERDELDALLDRTPMEMAAAVAMGEHSRRDLELYAGATVRAARDFVGISQRELARRSGVPHSVVNTIERGRRQPSVPLLARILRGAGLELRLEFAAYDPHDDDLDAEYAHMSPVERRNIDDGLAAMKAAGPARDLGPLLADTPG